MCAQGSGCNAVGDLIASHNVRNSFISSFLSSFSCTVYFGLHPRRPSNHILLSFSCLSCLYIPFPTLLPTCPYSIPRRTRRFFSPSPCRVRRFQKPWVPFAGAHPPHDVPSTITPLTNPTRRSYKRFSYIFGTHPSRCCCPTSPLERTNHLPHRRVTDSFLSRSHLVAIVGTILLS